MIKEIRILDKANKFNSLRYSSADGERKAMGENERFLNYREKFSI